MKQKLTIFNRLIILSALLLFGRFDLKAQRDYCIGDLPNCDYEYIAKVVFGEIMQESDGDAYTHYTEQTTDLIQGGSYPIEVLAAKPDGLDNISVWIDFNKDEVFSEDEKTILNRTEVSEGYLFDGDINIPVFAEMGETRMRIVLRYGDPHPCEEGSWYGEIEDYNVNIKPFNGVMAEFDYAPHQIGVGDTVIFTDASVGNTINFQWNFGENAVPKTASTQGPHKVVFTTLGKQNVSITVDNNSGEFSTETKTIDVLTGNTGYEPPKFFEAVAVNNNVMLSWLAPNETPQLANPESFEGSILPPPGWQIAQSTHLYDNAANELETIEIGSTWKMTKNQDYVHSGEKGMYIQSSYTLPLFNWLITPEVAINAGDKLHFFMDFKHFGSVHTKLEVLVFANNVWTKVKIYDENSVEFDIDQEQIIDLAGYAGENIKIAFVYRRTGGGNVGIDDVSISSDKSNDKLAKSNWFNPKGETLTGFKIYRNKKELVTLGADARNYKDSILPVNEYSYTMSAVYGAKESFPLDSITLTTSPVEFDFSASSDIVGLADSVVYTASIKGSYNSIEWDFGEGAVPATANTEGPHVVRYNTLGYKVVRLTLDDTIYIEKQIISAVPGSNNFQSPLNLMASVNLDNVTLNWEDITLETAIEEGFEGSTFPPAGWLSKYSETISATPTLTDPTATNTSNKWGTIGGEQYVHSGQKAAYIGYTAPAYNWLITPEVEIKGNAILNFWLFYKNSQSNTTNFRVMILADGMWNEALFYTAGTPNNEYNHIVSIDLSEYNNKNIKIAFVYESTDGWELAIDDVVVKVQGELPSNFTKYNVYRNAEIIKSLPEVTAHKYTDTVPNTGTHKYYVTAVYNTNDESLPTNEAKINAYKVLDLPYSQDFEGTVDDFIFNDGQYSWKLGQTDDFNTNGYQFPMHEGNYVAVNTNGSQSFPPLSELLLASPMNFDITGKITLELSYFSRENKFKIMMRDSADGEWSTLKELSPTNKWTNLELIIPDEHKFNGAQIGFYYENSEYKNDGIAIDNFKINTTEGKQFEISYNNQTLGADSLVHFGSVALSQPKQISFDISSIGSESVTFENITVEGNGFTLVSAPATDSVLAYNETAKCVIKFEAATAGIYSGKVIIKSDALTTPDTVNIEAFAGSAWSYMLYMKDNDQNTGLDNLNEWEVVGSLQDTINYICLYDANNNAEDGIYLIKKDNDNSDNLVSEKISDHLNAGLDMNNWETLKDFTIWTKENYPALHYGLNVWSRDSNFMKLWEMDKALAAFKNTNNRGFDVVGFDVVSNDTALYGQVETAYQLKDYTDFVVFSEKIEPQNGWDYQYAFADLNANYDMKVSELVKKFVNSFDVEYTGVAPTTQSAVELKDFDEKFVTPLNDFAQVMITNMFENVAKVKEAANETWHSDGNSAYIDLGNFLSLLLTKDLQGESINPKIQNLLNAYNEVVVVSMENQLPKATGMKIWVTDTVTKSPNFETYSNATEYLKFGSETEWLNLLKEIEIPKMLNVQFEADYDSTIVNQVITLTNQSVAVPEISSTQWVITPGNYTLEDGTNLSSSVLKVKFTQFGKYKIKLITSNGYLTDSLIKEDYITVIDVSQIVDFEATTTDCYTTQTVSINSDVISATPIQSYTWTITPDTYEFVEGTNANSENIKVKFLAAEKYDIKLETENAGGAVHKEKVDYITVRQPTLSVDIAMQDTSLYVGQEAMITGYVLASPDVENYAWTITPANYEFVGGTDENSNNIRIRFTQVGNYTVKLSASNEFLADSIIKTNYINVKAPSLAVDFSADIVTPYLEQQVVITSNVTSAPETVDYSWIIAPNTFVFTEGTDNNSDEISVKFTALGNYTVKLVANNGLLADSLIKSDFIKVTNPNYLAPHDLEADYNSSKQITTLTWQTWNANDEVIGVFAGFKIYRNNDVVAFLQSENQKSYKDDMSALDPGEYTYKVSALWSAPNGESEPTNEVVINHTISIDDYNLSKVKLYPNPNNGSFTIDLANIKNAEWSLINAKGQIIETNKAQKAQIKVDNVPAGLYYIKLTVENSSRIFKVVVN